MGAWGLPRVVESIDEDSVMKLIYLYIEDFPPYKQQNLNFVSDYRCKFEDGVLIVKYKQVLPTKFFTRDNSAELFVSALVGPNGAGKTSVIRFLETIFYLKRGPKYVAFIESKGELVIYHNYPCDIKVESEGCSIKVENILGLAQQEQTERAGERIEKSFQIVYFSPHYSVSSPISHSQENFFWDISTTGLLNKIAKEAFHKPINVEHKFRRDETLRAIRFYREAKFKLPKPKRILVEPRTWAMAEIIADFSALIGKEEENRRRNKEENVKLQLRLEDEELAYLKGVVTFLCEEDKDPFLVMIKCLIAELGMSTNGFCSKSFSGSPIKESMLSFIKEKSRWKKDEIVSFFDEYSLPNDIDGLVPQLIRKLSVLQVSGSSLIVSDVNQSKEAEELVDLSYRSSQVANFIDFTFDPHLSAGEYSRLMLYSRLYEVFEDRRALEAEYDGTDFSDYYADHWESGWLVFMDEAEITLHPEWQQCLISDLLDTFNSAFKGFNVHFIFATHSPILLSDIPIGNTVFVSKGAVRNVEMGGLRNTFGASIFNLYRHGFGLTAGSWGKFADGKLQEAMDVANGDGSVSSDNRLLINLIGDEFVSTYLKQAIRMRSEDRKVWSLVTDEKTNP